MAMAGDRSKDASIERRRQRNREAMHRLRERQQHAIALLRETARSLEAMHADLLWQRQQASSSSALVACALPSLQLEEAMYCTRQLVAANTQLQKAIDERVRWEDHIALLAEYLGKEVAPPPPPPPTFNINFVTAPRLSEARAMEFMLFHRNKHKALKKQWFSASRAKPFASNFFGWDIRYFSQGRYWHLNFSKLFCNVPAQTVSRRVWGNMKQLVTYRKRLPNQRIVQVINDNAFVLARWTTEKNRLLTRNKVMYVLRFRMEEPDGTTAVATQTLPEPGERDIDAFDDKVFPGGEDVCLCIRLKPVKDTATGEEHCLVEFSGRTQFGEADHAQFNALEMVLSLTRWEEANVARSPIQLVWS